MGSNSPDYIPPEPGSVERASGWENVPQNAPAEAGVPQSEVPRRRKPLWMAAPATHILLAVNIGVWLAMVSTKVSPISPTVDQLVSWGADRAGDVLIYGQWWRIVTAMFIHVGIIHLATNMWCLWNLGLLAEPLMGSWGVLAVYILTGAAGNLLSTFSNWWSFQLNWLKYQDLGVFPAGAGASGAVFGIAGALIILLKSNRLPVPPIELKKLRRSVIYFAAINLFIGISISFGTEHFGKGILIDNYAHMGGCACGLLFAAPMVPRLGSPRPSFDLRLRIAIGMVVGLLVLFGFYLAQLPPQN
ncbi:MAG TPA: rhomboid family intramembrane serine protease [Terracidiphilus sp.]|nr:rhomboid family intramembrane serine protease [Terracidiphilus sp.]